MNTVTVHSTAEIKYGLCMSREGWVKAADHEASMPAWRRTPNAEGWWIAWDGKYPSLHFVSHLKHRDGLHVYLRSTWRHVATLGNEFECWQPVTVPSYFDGLNAKDRAPVGHDDSATLESADGAGSSPSSCSAPVLFPRNPERDENGRAVLYPGLPRFEGVCGLFTTDEGEVAIIAPTFEALDAHVRKMGVSAEVSRDACILATWDRVPNDQGQTRREEQA